MATVLTPSDKPPVENRRSDQVAPAAGPVDHALLDRTPWPANNRCEKKHSPQPSRGRTEHARAA